MTTDWLLRQHFQNYFDLLLATEHAKLQRQISVGTSHDMESLMNAIDQRISYLKGAVRMGQLLCLINAEEAKLKHAILSAERSRLQAICDERFSPLKAASHVPARDRIQQLRGLIGEQT